MIVKSSKLLLNNDTGPLTYFCHFGATDILASLFYPKMCRSREAAWLLKSGCKLWHILEKQLPRMWRFILNKVRYNSHRSSRLTEQSIQMLIRCFLVGVWGWIGWYIILGHIIMYIRPKRCTITATYTYLIFNTWKFNHCIYVHIIFFNIYVSYTF